MDQRNDDWGGDGFERGVFADNRETRFPDTAVFVHWDEEPEVKCGRGRRCCHVVLQDDSHDME